MRRGGPLVHVSHRYIYIYTRARALLPLDGRAMGEKNIYVYR